MLSQFLIKMNAIFRFFSKFWIIKMYHNIYFRKKLFLEIFSKIWFSLRWIPLKMYLLNFFWLKNCLYKYNVTSRLVVQVWEMGILRFWESSLSGLRNNSQTFLRKKKPKDLKQGPVYGCFPGNFPEFFRATILYKLPVSNSLKSSGWMTVIYFFFGHLCVFWMFVTSVKVSLESLAINVNSISQ